MTLWWAFPRVIPFNFLSDFTAEHKIIAIYIIQFVPTWILKISVSAPTMVSNRWVHFSSLYQFDFDENCNIVARNMYKLIDRSYNIVAQVHEYRKVSMFCFCLKWRRQRFPFQQHIRSFRITHTHTCAVKRTFSVSNRYVWILPT